MFGTFEITALIISYRESFVKLQATLEFCFVFFIPFVRAGILAASQSLNGFGGTAGDGAAAVDAQANWKNGRISR